MCIKNIEFEENFYRISLDSVDKTKTGRYYELRIRLLVL